ncbi:hypothetical protein [Terrisporobacter vanillatitrophus]|uniref:hypothetical protein n=1 Tax=Terrisporobacter vanillatitrophus TaxID=3058402 RepID=UPI0033696150
MKEWKKPEILNLDLVSTKSNECPYINSVETKTNSITAQTDSKSVGTLICIIKGCSYYCKTCRGCKIYSGQIIWPNRKKCNCAQIS